ncbi:casA [Symbiodinium sp. CCMP2592]|nr:casA [Symbiodinium sp. CCMP2592]
MDGVGLQARAAGNVAPEAALAWAMQSSGGSSSSSRSRTSAKAMRTLHCMDPGEAGVFANTATWELCIASICLGLTGRGLTRRRRYRTARQAMGKLVRPPLPPYMQADSQALLPQASQDIYVHPASRGVEHALTSDSLRTLCKALASASGSFLSNPEKGLDRTRRPKMDATLTIRALLRYSELRHTAGDDLLPQDYLGESGQGLRALLKHCRNYQLEVASALESREEDTVRMIRAFHDQVDLVKKYLPFFRTTLEKSFPALLRQSVEPMPRLISFLDSFGEVQLSFLYEAAKDKVFKARFAEMQPRHLLEVTDKWVSKARSGELAIVQSHKAKVVVRHVASLDISLPPEERAVWMSLAIWGSVLETSPEVELIEDRIRKGALTRGDPVEMLSLAEGMGDIHGFSDEMFDMIQAPINQAMLRMGPERASQALASLTFRTGYLQKPADKALARLLKPERLVKKVYKWKLGDDRYFPKLKKKDPPKPKRPKEALAGLIVKVLGFFTENMPLTALEYVLAKWVRKNFRLEACYEVASDHLFRIIAGEENLVDPEKSEEDVLVPPGSFARCGQHLVGLGLPGYTFAPAVDWLLCHQVGWTERKAFPEEAVSEDVASLEDATKRRRAAATKLVESSLPLLSHLWPVQMSEGETEDASMEQFSLQNADELLRLVGRTEDRQGRKRKADVAANELVQRLSTQLMFDDLPQKAETAMCAWREDQPETSLSTIVAPLLLEAAHIGAERGMPEQRPGGVLSRSVSLLAQAINLQELSLQSAEWALIPFEAAESSEEAVSLVAASCAVGGVPEDVMAETCTAWLDLGNGKEFETKAWQLSFGICKSLDMSAFVCLAGLAQLRKAFLIQQSFRILLEYPMFVAADAISEAAQSDVPGHPHRLRHSQHAALMMSAMSMDQLWRTSTRHHAPRRYKAYMRLLSTLMELECIAAFSGCFPGGWEHEARVSNRACGFFRTEVSNVLVIDNETEAGTAYQQAGINAIVAESSFAAHPCYGHNLQVGNTAKYEEHISLRVMALALGINLEKTRSYWIPSWDTHVELTGVSCDTAHSLWWHLALRAPLQVNTEGWVVNVGAGDGSCSYGAARGVFQDLDVFKAGDPANCLLHAGFQGILFEGDSEKAQHVRQVFAQREGIWVVDNTTNPFKVLKQVVAYRDSFDLRTQPLLLKVDVDNCDCCFVMALLERGLRPQHIHVEVNSFVPPPIFFRPVEFDNSIKGDSTLEIGPESGFRGHMVHCSLAAFAEQLEPFGYKLVQLYLHDAHFARQDVIQGDVGEAGTSRQLWYEIEDLELAWNAGFYCHPLRPTQPLEVEYKRMFLYDYRQWNDKSLSVELRLRLLREYLDRWQKPRSNYELRVVGIPARTASSLRGALGGLAVLLDAIDGKPPSLSELARAKEAILAELGGKGMAALADAVALSWSMAMPGLRPAVAALHFEQWWNGQESRQELVAQIAGSGLQELSWNLSLKLKATFADKKPTEYASPAWRVEGVQKVPWFVPSGVVKEASKVNPVGLQKDRKKPPGFIGSKTAKKGAEEKSGGRCMYCASTYKLRAKHFFPPELGGTDYVSNVSMVCELCSDMHEALGPKRWGEVLSAEPEEAAEVWWEAQKKASISTVAMANFMDELATGSRRTWRDLCKKETPTVGSDGMLQGSWREAVVAAVACEKAGKAGRFADGPAGQVLDYMLERGFNKFYTNAEQTEEAAHAGRIRPSMAPSGAGAAIDSWSGGGKPHEYRPGKDDGKKPGSGDLQIRCGNCGNVYGVAVPPGTAPGATVQARCPHCGTTNQAAMPHTGGSPSSPMKFSGGGAPPRASGRQKALLIGVNYFGTRAELRGCINDVHNLFRLLTETYGWQAHNIRTLTDDGRGGGMPTRHNITQHLRWLAEDAMPGDVLFFSFSGHGAQKEDPQGFEEDGMNETILPVDFERAGMMTDDEVSDYIVKPLPEGVRLTSVMDCCHSGSGLDLPFTWDPRRGMWREAVNPFLCRGDVLMFSGCEDDDTSSDAASMYAAPGGAMTTAFCDVLRRNPRPIYPELLQLLHRHLSMGGFSQRPVLSSSQQFSLDRPFSFDDIHPNMNSQLGRIFRQRFPPRPRPMSGPLADMLGPLGMLAGGLVVGALAGEALEGGVGLLGALFG